MNQVWIIIQNLSSSLESSVDLDSCRCTSHHKAGDDTVGSVPDGTTAKNGGEEAGNGLLDGVLKDSWVLGPVVVEEAYG